MDAARLDLSTGLTGTEAPGSSHAAIDVGRAPVLELATSDGVTLGIARPATIGAVTVPGGVPGGMVFRGGKRIFDVVGSVLGLVICLPLIIGIVATLRLTSRGPAFYRQLRVGRRGRYFACWKFRTMVCEADELLSDLLASSPAMQGEYAENRKLVADPRVTRFGRFLRQTSLDELPQLWNVLKGEMSLVGPRPLLVDEPEGYGDALATVLLARPGLTGLWQVSGRSSLSYPERVELQAEQARQTSMPRDLLTVLRTMGQVVRWRTNGAY